MQKHNFNCFRQDGLVNYQQSWSLCDSRNKRQTSETVYKNLIDINTSRNDSVKLKAITDLKKDMNLVTAVDEADPAKSVSGRQIDADEWCDDSVSGGNTEQRDQEAEKEAEQKYIRKSYFEKEKDANFDSVGRVSSMDQLYERSNHFSFITFSSCSIKTFPLPKYVDLHVYCQWFCYLRKFWQGKLTNAISKYSIDCFISNIFRKLPLRLVGRVLAPTIKAVWGRMKEVKIVPVRNNDPLGMLYAPYRVLSGNL